MVATVAIGYKQIRNLCAAQRTSRLHVTQSPGGVETSKQRSADCQREHLRERCCLGLFRWQQPALEKEPIHLATPKTNFVTLPAGLYLIYESDIIKP